MSNEPAVIVGLGQMGGVFAHGLLKSGVSVVPVTRDRAADPSLDPSLVLVAVGEAELPDAVADLPGAWRDRVALLQNELVPRAWQALGLHDPTVAVVWFEKKKTTPLHVIQSTPIAGPHAAALVHALATLDVAAHVVDHEALVAELVLKNLYILTANIAGLALPEGTTVGALWHGHRALAQGIANEALALQRADVEAPLDADALLAALGRAFDADPAHGAKGRSASARLRRALLRAEEAGIDVPEMRAIKA